MSCPIRAKNLKKENMATIKETALELLKFAQTFDSDINEVSLQVGADAISNRTVVYIHLYKQDKHLECFIGNTIESVKDEINRYFNPGPVTLNNIEL